MFTVSTLRKAVLFSLYGSAALAALTPAAFAQSATDSAAGASPMQSVSVVGSRRATTSTTDTIVISHLKGKKKVRHREENKKNSFHLIFFPPELLI